MVTMRTCFRCGWVLVLALTLTSCKKKAEPVSPPSAPSSPSAPAEPLTPQPAQPTEPVARPAGWPHQPPDAALPDAKRPPDLKLTPISTDADLAKFKEEKERVESEKAVVGAVNGSISGVKACFDAQSMTAGSYTLQVRVHRSGRVLSSGVSGAGLEVNRCVEKALSGLRVSGLKTDTIDVEREIKYTAK